MHCIVVCTIVKVVVIKEEESRSNPSVYKKKILPLFDGGGWLREFVTSLPLKTFFPSKFLPFSA